tara:strand:- start:175 stop:687 length:513 start_codon:yes stop_codon:yes gene_type:complete
MSKYSNVFFGQKKYHSIPPFRFPIYNDLVAGEVEGIEEISRDQAKNTYSLLKIAKSIAEAKQIPVQEALDMLSDADSNQEILYDYVDELADIQVQGQSLSEQKIQTVSLIMRYRAEYKEKKLWVTTPDWEVDDTRAMPGKLLDQIYEYVDWERNGWPQDKPEEAEEDQGN